VSHSHAPLHRSNSPARDLTEAQRYYDEKTERLLLKYGPGPRVHFHTGLDARLPDQPTLDELRRELVASQERLVAHLDADLPVGRFLDVGCGLGGSAIHWAERGADVTAVTNVPRHVGVITALAATAQVRVRVAQRDAHDLRGLGTFDRAVAIESSCYLERARWFHELARVVVPGGRVHVIDCFLGDTSMASRFDSYWKTRIGSRDEYHLAAHGAGFEVVSDENLAVRVAPFWELSLAWSCRMQETSPDERVRLGRSMHEHAWLKSMLLRGGIAYSALTYARVA